MSAMDRKQATAKRKALLSQLKLQVDLACESRTGQRAHLKRAFNMLIKLLRIEQNPITRRELVKILVASNPDSDIQLSLDGRMLFVNGVLDCRELAKYVMWGHGVDVIDGEQS